MFSLIVQTLLLVAIAFILGAVIGCLLRGWFGKSSDAEADGEAAGSSAGGAAASGAVAAGAVGASALAGSGSSSSSSVSQAATASAEPVSPPAMPKPPTPVQPAQKARVETPAANLTGSAGGTAASGGAGSVSSSGATSSASTAAQSTAGASAKSDTKKPAAKTATKSATRSSSQSAAKASGKSGAKSGSKAGAQSGAKSGSKAGAKTSASGSSGGAQAAAAATGAADNLKLIKGIGPQNEARLNGMGVKQFAQIAAWKAKDEAHYGEALAFPGRIEREEWVKQAKVLAKGGSTDFAKRVKSGDVESSVGSAKADLGKAPAGLLSAARGGEPDNLTLIDGVGNAIEKKMFKLGLFHFDQVAKLSAEEQKWLGNSVGFPGRPERENWVGEAKTLASGGTTAHARRVERGEIKSSRKS